MDKEAELQGNGDTGGTQETEPRWETRCRYAKQVLMVSSASISYFLMGMSLTWTNVLKFHLATDNTTLFATELHVEEWQMDMLNSLISIGSVIGILLSGWLVRRIGRKKSLPLAVLPGLLGWATIGMARNTPMLLIGRFCDGITCGMVTLTAITYATEISDTAIRGTITAITCLMFLLGASFCVALTMAVTWYEVALGIAAVLLVYIFLVSPLLPESPNFLIVSGQEEKAIHVLKQLRGKYADVKTEMAQIRKMNDEASGNKGWRFLLQWKIQKRISVLLMLFLVQGFSGTAVLRANAVRILEASGVTGNTDIFATILLLVPIAGVFVLTWMVDKLGRRVCLVMSLAAMVVSYVVLGTSVYLQTHSFVSVVPLEFNDTAISPPYHVNVSSSDTGWWTTLISLIVCIFAMNLGIESLPWQLTSELFPTTIRSQAMTLSMTLGIGIAAIPLQLYSIMDHFLTTAGLFWFYAAVSGLGVIFTVLCVPETARKMIG